MRLSLRRFCELAQRDGGLAYLVARYLAEQLAEAQDLLAVDLFTDVRTRVARHLLDLAVLENGRFVVPASHQNIADAIGSVREVVTRSIKRLEAAGLVERDRRAMVLLDRAALHELASGHEPSRGTPPGQTDVGQIGATRRPAAVRR
jgi:CRP-like cAMP-binding protein